MIKKILILFAATLVAISASASRPTRKYAGWTIHPSFDNRPRRIIDTPDKVYLFVHQRPFNKTAHKDLDFSQPQYLTPAGAVFTIDKADPSAPMANINNLAPLSGADMVNFEVDPASGIMVFAYNDGGVDVVSKDYNVRYFNQIARRNFPGAAKVRNISFDAATSSVRVTCDSGFIEISTDDFSLVRSASWTKPVSDIISAAGHTAAIIDGKVCTANAGADIIRMKAFTEIPGVSSRFSGTPVRLMPLSDTTLGVVTDTGQIAFVTYADGKWSFTEKVKADNSIQLAANVSAAHAIEHTVIPNAGGYYVSTPAKAHLVKRAPGAASPSVTTVALPSGSTRWSDSYDGRTFWFYRERGQFCSAAYADSKWSPLSEPVRPEAPLTTSECLFAYAPGRGLMISSEAGGGYTIMNPPTELRQPALISLYKDGRWSNVAPVYNLPDAYNTDTSLRNAINANKNIWPVADPTGLAIDPISPNYVHFGSAWGGAVAYDFHDTSRMPLLKLSTKNAFQAFTTQKFPPQTWRDATAAFCAGFDADNNLWYLCNEYWNNEYPSKTYVSLWYVTPEGRRSALESGDPSKMEWNRMPVDQGVSSHIYNFALPLKHPENQGKIFWFTMGLNGTDRYAVIYDTRKTLDNQSDDSLDVFHKMLLPNGSNELFNHVNQAIEDPVTGQLYILSQFGTYVIDPSDKARNESFPAEMLALNDADGNPMELYSPFVCSRGTFDEYGRLWLGTLMGGVICIDPATRRMLAHYTTDNSPLPTNDIRGIGWNPDTKSLFISTHLGLLEVRPDNVSVSATPALQQPFLSTGSVNAGFTGTIAVHNAPAYVNLAVTDGSGRKVATLAPAVKGTAFWDLVSDEGLRVMPGLYYIRDISADSSFPSLPLVVK